METFTITQTGYREWKRTITLNPAGAIKIDAVLEKITQD